MAEGNELGVNSDFELVSSIFNYFKVKYFILFTALFMAPKVFGFFLPASVIEEIALFPLAALAIIITFVFSYLLGRYSAIALKLLAQANNVLVKIPGFLFTVVIVAGFELFALNAGYKGWQSTSKDLASAGFTMAMALFFTLGIALGYIQERRQVVSSIAVERIGITGFLLEDNFLLSESGLVVANIILAAISSAGILFALKLVRL